MYKNLGFSLADGCPKNGNEKDGKEKLVPINNPNLRTARGGARCCSKNGPGHVCKSECNGIVKQMVTLAVAKARCNRLGSGWRLCTTEELKKDKCCQTGCHYDVVLTWAIGSVSESENNNQGKQIKC